MKVTLHHLTADGAQTDPLHRDQVLGEVVPDTLGALLDRFRTLDAMAIHEHEPHVLVQTGAGKYLVRTGAGKLHLYDARDSSQPAIELDVPGLLAVFAGARPPAPLPDLLDLPPPNRSKQALGTLLLATGLVINAWAVYAFYRPEPGEPMPVLSPVTDPGEQLRLHQQLAGAYATGTGSEPGDRLIVLGLDDAVQLQVIEASHAIRNDTNPGGLVRQDGQLGIAVAGAGLIAPQPDGSLLYFGDRYHLLARK